MDEDTPSRIATSFQSQVTNSLGIRFVEIPAGEILMYLRFRRGIGQEKKASDYTLVQIEKPFFIAITPITQQQYFEVIGHNPSKFQGPNTQGLAGKHPVERVSWYDAINFCEKMTRIISSEGKPVTCRLPSEAEWEYACRAGTKTLQYFGDDENLIDQYAWHFGNASRRTHPVGELKPNGYGLYDMSGNVFEFCQDWYDHSHHLPPHYPKPAPRRIEKVIRGGSFQHEVSFCRPETRFYAHPDQSTPHMGFRIVVVT